MSAFEQVLYVVAPLACLFFLIGFFCGMVTAAIEQKRGM